MAVLIEGLQGSGKSYYASYHMYYDSKKYHSILTNIDGIKTTDKIKPLEFKKFTNEILNDCYNLQVVEDKSFDDVIEYLQSKDILPADVSENNRILLVVDEAQNYFGKSSKLEPALVWFITQHRHLYIELYLITQKYTLLRPDYHLFNLVYKAYPPVKQFSKSKIRYTEYAGLPLNEDNKSKTFSLPKEQKIFDMYVSGDKVESPNILKKYFLLFVALLVVVLVILYYFLSSFGGSTPAPDVHQKVETIINHRSPGQVVEKTNHKNKKLFEFVVWSDDYFYIRGVNDNSEYPIKFLSYIKKEFFLTVIENIKMSQHRTMLYVICDTEMVDFLNPKEDKKSQMGIQVKEELESI